MEVLGGIATIAQLATTVYSISKTLYEVSSALSTAPSDIADLARDLETFSDELHLLSSLLNGKDGRYADRVYRLTTKIIGDCASIRGKIDRIIGKLRKKSKNGDGKGEINVWGKVKWLYEEREILKLLARLRDLKLSLMGTLSVLSALRADALMDRLGVGGSLLSSGKDEGEVDWETRTQMEETRRKLAGLEVGRVVLIEEQAKTEDKDSNPIETPLSTRALNTRGMPNPFSFTAAVSAPAPIPLFTNQKAMESTQTFHSALSFQDDDQPKQYHIFTNTSDAWREDMAQLAVKRMNLSYEEAKTWAQSLPAPGSMQAYPAPAHSGPPPPPHAYSGSRETDRLISLVSKKRPPGLSNTEILPHN